ncbi:MAG: LysR family transcriptional regulator [Streptosporangiales bacterium]|nr:LysR family transcriptional regulator [Streptosporangiales bacterium]
MYVFAAVVRHGSVHAAAEALHVTGPAVSQQLRRLEREAGCPLVTRDGRGIRLTHAGRVLAESARTMADTAAQGAADLAQISELVAGPLRIGAVASAIRALVPQALLELANEYPGLEPEVRDGESEDMMPDLAAGRLDLVIIESWTHAPARIGPGVRAQTVARERALLAVRASCPAGSETQEALVQLLRSQGFSDASVRYHVADFSTQLQLVAAGLTVALIPRMAVPTSHPVHAFIVAFTRAGNDVC